MPTQTTNVSNPGYGILYTAAGQTWTIAKGVSVSGGVGAVYSGFVNSTLINKGDLFGGTFGVNFDAGGLLSNYTVINKASGEIDDQYGVYIANFLGAAKVDNAGDISATLMGVYVSGSTDVSVKNIGKISSDGNGVFVASSSAGTKGTVVDNYGKIEADQTGVYISGPSNVVAQLVNHKGGLIDGDGFALDIYSPIKFKNEGKVVGTVLTSAYDDVVVNKGKINGNVKLYAGDDVLKNKGGAKVGGLIDTGDGNDMVVLGTKAEKLLFDYFLDPLTNVDTIKKFASGKDKFLLDDDIFTNIAPGKLSGSAFHKGTSAADADDRIIYDKKSGALYYDQDGLGGVAQVQFAKLDGGPKLKASDFTIGEFSL